MDNRIRIAVLFVVMAIFSANAQCKSFVKKKCMPALAPYITNGQINTATFSPGDNAEIPLNFFENTSYRIIVCNQEVLGKISFKVMDANRNILFDNGDHDDTNKWDFKSSSNQSLILLVSAPEVKDNHSNIVPSGCVSVIIGFKKS